MGFDVFHTPVNHFTTREQAGNTIYTCIEARINQLEDIVGVCNAFRFSRICTRRSVVIHTGLLEIQMILVFTAVRDAVYRFEACIGGSFMIHSGLLEVPELLRLLHNQRIRMFPVVWINGVSCVIILKGVILSYESLAKIRTASVDYYARSSGSFSDPRWELA